MMNRRATVACTAWIALLLVPSLGLAVPDTVPAASDRARAAIDGGLAALPLLGAWLAGFVALCGRVRVAAQPVEREAAGRQAPMYSA